MRVKDARCRKCACTVGTALVVIKVRAEGVVKA